MSGTKIPMSYDIGIMCFATKNWPTDDLARGEHVVVLGGKPGLASRCVVFVDDALGADAIQRAQGELQGWFGGCLVTGLDCQFGFFNERSCRRAERAIANATSL